MNVVTIIQARMGSTRLPGKVLKDIGGETMLARVVKRASRAKQTNHTVVATTKLSADDQIVEECTRLGVDVFRGDHLDVLDRYHKAAEWYEADVIVRVTADCPLIDPGAIDSIITDFNVKDIHYISNRRHYPKGLDTEVMTWGALAIAWREAIDSYDREHVTPFLYHNPERFRLGNPHNEFNYSGMNWSVDTEEGLGYVRHLYDLMGNVDTFSWIDLIQKLEAQE